MKRIKKGKSSTEKRLKRLTRTVRYEKQMLKAQQLKIKNAEDEMKELTEEVKSQRDLKKEYDKQLKQKKKEQKKVTVTKHVK